MSDPNGAEGASGGVEDAKEAAVRALLFASPSPRSGSRSLNTSVNGGSNSLPASPLSLSMSAVPIPSSNLRVRTEIPIPTTERRGSIDGVAPTSTTPTLTPTGNGIITPRHSSPPKWSQRHLHHHLPSTNPSPSPSPSLLSPALTPVPSAIISPSHSGLFANDKEKGSEERGGDKERGSNESAPTTGRGAGVGVGGVGVGDRRKLSSKNLLADYGDEDTLRQKLLELKDKRRKSNFNSAQVDKMLSSSLDDLNITGEDINFDELESFLKESQEDHSVKEALMQGVELKEYGQKVDAELKTTENAIVPICILALILTLDHRMKCELHSKVGGCVDILSAFEKLLTSFQGDLSNISEDIKNMQDQSMEKNIKINNRKAVISKLGRFIDDISLPPSYVEQLEKGQMDMSYLQLLASFNRKLGFMSMQRAKGAVAIEDMYRKFNSSLDKVIARVHKYTVNQTATIKSFAQLRDTQLELSSMSFLYQFLFIHAPDNARDVKAAYMDTCDKFYTNYYKSYINTMSKYLFDIATKNDVIGIEDSKLRDIYEAIFRLLLSY